MRTKTLAAGTTACALLVAIGASISIGGPLNPPPGPITPTYKTLTEIEPRTAINAANTPGNGTAMFMITQPGSYYLTADLIGDDAKNGLVIATDNVTVDLNGFQVVGTSESLKGICVTALNSRLVCIRNGTVRGWTEDGVCTVNVSGSVLEQLRVWNNGGNGIEAGPAAIVKGCTAQQNGEAGIAVGNNGMLSECTAQENQGAGIDLGNGSVMTACTSGHNAGPGVVSATGCTLSASTARSNGADGFQLLYGCTVNGCSASFNALDGFSAVGSGVSIRGCTAEANTRDGIRALSDCVIAENSCDSNGYSAGDGAGIHTLGMHNRIDRNNITDCDRGIQVEGTHNLIIRNTVSDNAVQFIIGPGNMAGTIVASESELNAANANANVAF
jgi:parallel beta-helix repeat protein